MKILRHLFSFILPVLVLIIVPLILENDFRVGELWTTIPGIGLLGVGMLIIINTIVMFIKKGRGTLAPWDPTRNIVTDGLYAYVRNPMIPGVLTVLAGESLLFRSINIAFWSILFFLFNHLYFIFSEEPGLAKRFGQEYHEYKQNAPRWIPRLKLWHPGNKKA